MSQSPLAKENSLSFAQSHILKFAIGRLTLRRCIVKRLFCIQKV